MEILNYNPLEIFGSKIKFNFNHPLKELIWLCDPKYETFLQNYLYPQIRTDYRKYTNLTYDKIKINLEIIWPDDKPWQREYFK